MNHTHSLDAKISHPHLGTGLSQPALDTGTFTLSGSKVLFTGKSYTYTIDYENIVSIRLNYPTRSMWSVILLFTGILIVYFSITSQRFEVLLAYAFLLIPYYFNSIIGRQYSFFPRWIEIMYRDNSQTHTLLVSAFHRQSFLHDPKGILSLIHEINHTMRVYDMLREEKQKHTYRK